MDLIALKQFLDSNNQPSYRFKQISKNYFSGRFKSFGEMTDLPLILREKLDQNLAFYSTKLDKIFTDNSTQKALLTLSDNQKIETVLMDYDDWITACISSQVGCALGCKFCATSKMGFKRNLTSEEIVDQILFWNNKLYPKYIGRIVFMGMGEPFLNWDNLLESIKIINSKDGLNIGARKISISTAGITDKIIDFANLDTQINLAISLHSVDQKTRESIMPIAQKYPLPELKKACDYYTQKTNRQLFFEYALMKDINDKQSDLKNLIDFIRSNRLYYLNIIPLNEVTGCIAPSPQKTIYHFTTQLTQANIDFSLRRSFGQSIHAACGQLITTI